jgi:hypothetical protein
MKLRTTLFSLLVIALIITTISCSNSAPAPANPQQVKSAPSPVWTHKTLNLVNGIITVKAGGWYSTSFTVSGNPSNETLIGSFTASGGSGNDIIALLLDDTAYTNWSNGHQVNVYYNSGQITTGKINVSITSAGKYFFVFSNRFSTFTSKEVNANVNVGWDELSYQ